MIWLFTRQDQDIRLETRHDTEASEFVVELTFPDAHRTWQRFKNHRAFQAWLSTLDSELAPDGWIRSGPFITMPDVRAGRHIEARVASQNTAASASDAAVRTYVAGPRSFDVTLSTLTFPHGTFWVVSSVTEGRGGQPATIPSMNRLVSRSPDITFARACDAIDKWLFGQMNGIRMAQDESRLTSPLCPDCGARHTRIVHQSGFPPVVYWRCDTCGRVFSGSVRPGDGARTA
jgi:hypothetical protein